MTMNDGFSLADAFGPSAFDRAHEHYALFYALGDGVWGRPLSKILALVDPNHAGARIDGEPGWSTERQMVPGEERRLVARLRVEFANAKPKPPTFAEPPPDAGPDPAWPAWARFKAELAFPDEFDNPKYPRRYYDAQTFEGFLTKILAAYLKHHPESAQQVEQILANAHDWVEHDAKYHRRGI
jgi:hypothetical protein